jgi:hypothetical protein
MNRKDELSAVEQETTHEPKLTHQEESDLRHFPKDIGQLRW